MNKKGISSKTWWIIAIAVIVVVLLIVLLRGVLTGNAAAVTQCSDRIDNDKDGKCDYSGSRRGCTDGSVKGDTGCSSTSDTTEASCVAGSTTCGVGECLRSSTCVNDQVSCTPGNPSTCTSLGKTCGNWSDGCGSYLNCGTCQSGYQCNNGVCQIMNTSNSCADTDGGFKVNITGTVSGYKNNVSYSNTDLCVSNVTLREFYC